MRRPISDKEQWVLRRAAIQYLFFLGEVLVFNDVSLSWQMKDLVL
jgi:hypothetical protein